MTPTQEPAAEARTMAMRMWRTLCAAQELLTIYLGVRLGLYDELAVAGPATAPELAARAGIDLRYAREWLEQQAVAAILTVDAVEKPADDRRYTLPPGHARVLTLSDRPESMAALAVLPLGGVAGALPHLLTAYRSGAGVPDSAFGVDWREGHAGANRAIFTHQLGGWIAALLPDVHDRLSSPGARIADVACGAGWSSIALARAYPQARVDGLDLDPDAISDARRNAARAGVTDRVRFAVRDAADAELTGSYDLVCLLDALHEMSRPVDVLRACRELRNPSGAVVVMDARVAPRFTAPGDDVERFQYATSVLHCLPACLAGADSMGTGTVMRPDAVAAMARQADFTDVRELAVADRFHRLYRMVG